MKSLSKIVHGVALRGYGNVISPGPQAFSLGYRMRPRWGQETSFTALPGGLRRLLRNYSAPLL